MNDYEFYLVRIFFGDKPPMFLLEVALRTLIIVSYTLLLLRWMGKRGMGQLTPFEFTIIVGLGSAVGDPMFYDDVPLVHTMLVIAIIVGLQHFLSWVTEKNETIESWVEGVAVCLIEDGTINMPTLESERLSQSEFFDSLRSQGIVHIGHGNNFSIAKHFLRKTIFGTACANLDHLYAGHLCDSRKTKS